MRRTWGLVLMERPTLRDASTEITLRPLMMGEDLVDGAKTGALLGDLTLKQIKEIGKPHEGQVAGGTANVVGGQVAGGTRLRLPGPRGTLMPQGSAVTTNKQTNKAHEEGCGSAP